MVFTPWVTGALILVGVCLAPGVRTLITAFTTGDRTAGRLPVQGPGLVVTMLVTVVVFAAISLVPGDAVDQVALAWMGAAGVVLGFVDAATHRLPHAITLPALVGVLAVFATASLVADHHGALVRAVLSGLVGFGVYAVAVLVKPAWLGFGDAILAGVLGVVLGWRSWSTLGAAGVLVVWVTGLHAVGLIVLRRAGRDDELPAAPGMLLGTLLALLLT